MAETQWILRKTANQRWIRILIWMSPPFHMQSQSLRWMLTSSCAHCVTWLQWIIQFNQLPHRHLLGLMAPRWRHQCDQISFGGKISIIIILLTGFFWLTWWELTEESVNNTSNWSKILMRIRQEEKLDKLWDWKRERRTRSREGNSLRVREN